MQTDRRVEPREARPLVRVALILTAAALMSGPPAAHAQDSVPTADKPAAARVPGAESDVLVELGDGMKVAVRHVEGARPQAPLSPTAKPRPQNDWYVQRFRTGVPSSLNPDVTPDRDASGIARHVLGRLIDLDPDHPPKVTGSLAVSWEVTDKGRTCTYRLRKGVQFADGSPFTSADVQFTFDALRDAGVNAGHLRPAFEKVAEFTAPDPHTVVARFKKNHWKAPYLIGRSLWILNKSWYERRMPLVAAELGIETVSVTPGKPGFADVFNRIRGLCPGTGPYQLAFETDVSDGHVHLRPNAFSWEMQVHPERHNFAGLRWVYMPSESDSFFAFVRGDLDVWVVSHSTWEHQLSRDPRISGTGSHFVYDHIGIDASVIAWNCRKPPFDDANVRTAMTHLTDREAILSRVMQGHGQIAVCKSKPSYPTYTADLKPHAFDRQRANVHLIRAGWDRDSDDDGILDKDGEPFSFELMVPAGRRDFQVIGEILSKAYEEVGIHMTLRPVSPKQFATAVRKHDFDALCGFSAWPDPWIDLYDGYHSSRDRPGQGNVTGWRNERADALLEQMQAELDDAAREALHHEFNRVYYTEQPETLLVHGKVGVLLNKRFEGVSVRPTGLQSFDLWVRPENVRHGSAAK